MVSWIEESCWILVRLPSFSFLDIRCKLTKTWGSSIWIPGQYTNVPADIFLCIFVKVQGVFFQNFIGLTKFSMINWCACLTKKPLKLPFDLDSEKKIMKKIMDREITFSDNQAPVSYKIGGFHVTSSLLCWWTETKDRSLARFVCPPSFVHFTIVICVSRDCMKTTYWSI